MLLYPVRQSPLNENVGRHVVVIYKEISEKCLHALAKFKVLQFENSWDNSVLLAECQQH